MDTSAVEPNAEKDGLNSKTRQRKVLNKIEKTSIVYTMLSMLVMMRVCSQLPLLYEDLRLPTSECY